MLMSNRGIGSTGESYAERYLISKGYKIIDKNWTCRWGEIDIVAHKNCRLVFIEVKYRNSDKFGSASQAITTKKLKSLKSTIWRYLYIYDLFHQECRLDIICIYPIKRKLKLRHYKSVAF